MTNSSFSCPKAQPTNSPPRPQKARAGLARDASSTGWQRHVWGRGALVPLAGTGRGDGEVPDPVGRPSESQGWISHLPPVPGAGQMTERRITLNSVSRATQRKAR